MEPLSRPQPAASLVERARSWLAWFGVGRLVAAVVATIVVVAGGVWLLNSPAPTTEATIPVATTAGGNTNGRAPGDVASGSMTTATTPPLPSTPSTIVVHVAGAVVEAGVYELDAPARVRDALIAAGGPQREADWNALNLATPLSDGVRVYVPALGEQSAGEFVTGGAPASADSVVPGPIDLNRATAAQLDELPGVGPATAAAILDERERNGPFASVDDLERVPGIGPAKLDALRDLVRT